MPKYEVIKAHDGLSAGTIKDVPADSISAYMVENGYWREIAEEPAARTKSDAEQPVEPKTEPAAAPASIAAKPNQKKNLFKRKKK